MKTIVVPIDFSDTSKNAAIFSAQLAATIPGCRIILYYEFSNFVSGSDSSPLANEPEARKKIAEMALENVKTSMQNVAIAEISYVAAEDSSFIKSLAKFINDQNADLVIMGINATSGIEQALMGSNTLNLVNKNVCPVMIVPPNAHFKGIKNILFATDYKEIETSTPVKNIKTLLQIFRPDVHIVNVQEEDRELSEDLAKEKKKLQDIFNGYKHEFHFLRQDDFADAISQFVADKNIDLILTVSRKHSFLSTLFSTSHTKQLVYHSHVPVLAIHE
jgi:nucleotide-binding universal stress UspA family protein